MNSLQTPIYFVGLGQEVGWGEREGGRFRQEGGWTGGMGG